MVEQWGSFGVPAQAAPETTKSWGSFGAPPSGSESIAAAPEQKTPLQSIADFGVGVVKDTLEGAIAPITAPAHLFAGEMAKDPDIRAEELKKAGMATLKGVAFYGSLYAGGLGSAAVAPMVESIATKGLLAKIFGSMLRGGIEAGTFAGTNQAITQLPDLAESKDIHKYAAEVGTAAAFGAVTGLAFPALGAGLKAAGKESYAASLKIANRILDVTPGGAVARSKAIEAAHGMSLAWSRIGTSGESALRAMGLGSTVEALRLARSTAALLGGGYVSRFKLLIHGLTPLERRTIAGMAEGIDFHRSDFGAATAAAYGPLFDKAKEISGMLRELGEGLQAAGMKVLEDDQGYRAFILTDRYLPRRFVNPALYREDGLYRKQAIEQVKKGYTDYNDAQAKDWLDKFADRIQSEIDGSMLQPGSPGGQGIGVSHYMQARSLHLPGYETDVDKIIPQYLEAASKKLTLLRMFGSEKAQMEAAPFASAPAQRELFQFFGKQITEKGGEEVQTKQLKIGFPKTPSSPEQNALLMKLRAVKEAERASGVYQRYPNAFKDLPMIEDPEKRALAQTLIRRQLGAIDQAPPFAQNLLSKAAFAEVVTKLALGVIAQPTQILSGAVRTNLTAGIKGLVRTLANRSDAYDFALRSGVILRGLVRQSEESLTGQVGRDFLEKVYFTQADLFSRVVGAHQGAAFAEFQASKLASMVKARDAGQAFWKPMFGRATPIDQAIKKIELKLTDLGLDSGAIVSRGGVLNEDEILRAAQKVSTDVNFWGDQLSLPEFFKSPYGRFLTMFKSFGFQQSRLIKDYVVRPAMQGDIGPALRMLATMPAAGELVTDIKKLARGKTRHDQDMLQRILTNTSNAAGFGLVYDAIASGGYGLAGIFGLGAGPVYSEPAKFAEATYNAAQGDPDKLIKWWIETAAPTATAAVFPRFAPLVATTAPWISNQLIPPRNP